jgi:hypothetical protein
VSQISSEILTKAKIESLLEWASLRFSPNFSEKFEMESSLGMLGHGIQKEFLLVFWPHSVFGQNHLSVKML